MSLDRDAFYIDGGWRTPASDATLQVVSPHSEEVIATVPEASVGDVDAAVAAARKAFDEGPWPRMTPAERIAVIEAFSGLYAAKLTEMAELISLEMGSPTSFSQLAQSPAPWMQIESFLAIAREFPWEAARPGSLGSDVVVRHEPVGVVAAIPPWNVPQFTVMSKVVPALLADDELDESAVAVRPVDGVVADARDHQMVDRGRSAERLDTVVDVVVDLDVAQRGARPHGLKRDPVQLVRGRHPVARVLNANAADDPGVVHVVGAAVEA